MVSVGLGLGWCWLVLVGLGWAWSWKWPIFHKGRVSKNTHMRPYIFLSFLIFCLLDHLDCFDYPDHLVWSVGQDLEWDKEVMTLDKIYNGMR